MSLAILFYFTSYVLNMFRTLTYPSSGSSNYSVELPHWSYCSWFEMCWSFGVVGLEWYPCCRLKHNTDTTPTQPHRNSNTHRTKNNTTNVVNQQSSRKILMMDILKYETRWAHKKWNKIASDIKLVFYSSTLHFVYKSHKFVPHREVISVCYKLYTSHKGVLWSRQALLPTQPLSTGYLSPFRGAKGAEGCADVRNMWSYMSNPLYVLAAW